jgi:hypothetical protein
MRVTVRLHMRLLLAFSFIGVCVIAAAFLTLGGAG